MQVMALHAARQLLRTRTEVDRILGLRALSARTTVLDASDEKMQLLSDITRKFDIPSNEMLQLCCPCSCKLISFGPLSVNTRGREQGGNMQHGWRQARLLLLTNHLLIDYDIFGPTVHGSSIFLHESDVVDVSGILQSFEGGVPRGSLSLASLLGSLEVRLSNSNAVKAQKLFKQMAVRARVRVERARACPFRSPLLSPIFSGAKRVNLSSGQTFTVAPSSAYCFLQAEKGHFIIKKHGKMLAELTQGDMWGLPEFVRELPIAGVSLVAHGNHPEFVLSQVCL